jgi:uncharacterized membrane protein YecN with MAPEG domain
MILPISLTIAAAATLVNLWLGGRVSRMRLAHKVSIGDGGVAPLLARMRAQANFVEYTPFFLILLALIELGVGSPLWLWIVGALYILARICHGLGMDGGRLRRLRTIGMMSTALILVGLMVVALVLAYSAEQQRRSFEAPLHSAEASRR